MTESTCRTCHATGPHHTQLVRDATGDRMVLCPSCLHWATRMQADARDARGRRRLADHADQNGLQVWSSSHVAYVLRSAAGTEGLRPTATLVRAGPGAPEDRMTRVTVPHA